MIFFKGAYGQARRAFCLLLNIPICSLSQTTQKTLPPAFISLNLAQTCGVWKDIGCYSMPLAYQVKMKNISLLLKGELSVQGHHSPAGPGMSHTTNKVLGVGRGSG